MSTFTEAAAGNGKIEKVTNGKSVYTIDRSTTQLFIQKKKTPFTATWKFSELIFNRSEFV